MSMSTAEEDSNIGAGEEEGIPTASYTGSEDGPGGQIGPYKLLRVLGEGGFGMVYLAEQQKPIKRRVALKIIKLGMDSKQIIARFEAERQALALLDHPNIAHVFNAGTTKSGRPYFVMEYVKGVPLTEHCDRQKLNIEARLGLFLRVCEGIQHAHQKGIIHRDIKPSNIQVLFDGQEAVPKIIDFGVAKAISQPLTERTLFTEQGQLVGTPEYMSPEQAEMTTQDIDTRSDIYSLGVLLYELLTGALPFEPKTLRQVAFGEIQRIVREEKPPRPSTRLSSLGEEATKVAQSRRTEVATLTKRLKKELEWIPLKAMRKERTHRYRSASELADDIQNYLSGAPLIAGPESVAYRLKKFIRRHRVPVTAVAAVAAALMIGLSLAVIGFVRASRARNRAVAAQAEAERQAKISLAVADFLENDVLASVDPAKAKGPEVTVRYILDAASDGMGDRFENEPLIEASIRQTLGSTYLSLGKYEAAEVHLERAEQIHREQLGREHPKTLTSMFGLARVYKEQRRADEAESFLAKTLDIRRRVLGAEHAETLRSMYYLAWLYWEHGRFDEAEALLVKALEVQRRVLGEEHPDTLKSMFGLGWTYFFGQNRFDKAELLLVKAMEGQRRVLGEEHPDTLRSAGALGELYQRQGLHDEAARLLVKMVEGSRRVLGEEHPDTLDFMSDLFWVYLEQGRYNEAMSFCTELIELDPNNVDRWHWRAYAYSGMKQWEKAIADLSKVIELASANAADPESRRRLTRAYCDLGDVLEKVGRLDDAQEAYQKAQEIDEEEVVPEEAGDG
jgi:serine/threonine protein kinase/Tfp pilus assembly protein PilF